MVFDRPSSRNDADIGASAECLLRTTSQSFHSVRTYSPAVTCHVGPLKFVNIWIVIKIKEKGVDTIS